MYQENLFTYNGWPVEGTVVLDAELAVSKTAHGGNDSEELSRSGNTGPSHITTSIKSIGAGCI